MEATRGFVRMFGFTMMFDRTFMILQRKGTMSGFTQWALPGHLFLRNKSTQNDRVFLFVNRSVDVTLLGRVPSEQVIVPLRREIHSEGKSIENNLFEAP